MRISTLFVGAMALLGLTVSSASAGEYYRGGYGGGVSYSSSCCYQKVVRHYSTTRYVRVNDHHYHRPAYQSAYYVSPPRRYVYDNYYAPPRYDHYQAPARYVSYGRYGYGGGYATRVSYGPECYTRRARVYDGYGGWVWVARRVCN